MIWRKHGIGPVINCSERMENAIVQNPRFARPAANFGFERTPESMIPGWFGSEVLLKNPRQE